MKTYSMVAVLALVAACSHNRPQTFTATAPRDALACALRAATDSGYVPQRGGLAEGYVYLTKRRSNGIGEKSKEALVRIITLGQKGVDRSIADRLYIVGADLQLRITASSIDEKGKEGSPTDAAQRMAQFLLRRCAAG